MEGAQWMPDLGGFLGLLTGPGIVSYVFREHPNSLVAIGWLILGAIGGAIGGFMMGSVCNTIICRSISKRMRRP